MSADTMKNVYILTEEGRGYSNAGCDFIKDIIFKRWKDTSDLLFSMGTVYNDPKHLMHCVDMHPECYVTVSTAENVIVINALGVQELREILNEEIISNSRKSSWQLKAAPSLWATPRHCWLWKTQISRRGSWIASSPMTFP